MKLYAGSPYGFCEVCSKTVIPTTMEDETGVIELLCPTCAELTFDDAIVEVAEKCVFGGCHRPTIAACSRCEDPICGFHESEGFCDICKPTTYTKGWSARSGHSYAH